MEEQYQIKSENSFNLQQLEAIISEISNNSLLQGSQRRKAAFENGQNAAYNTRNVINFSFGNSPTNKFALAAYLRQRKIGNLEDISESLSKDLDIFQIQAEQIPTPSLSSNDSAENVEESVDIDRAQGQPDRNRRKDRQINDSSQKIVRKGDGSIDKEQVLPKAKNYLNIYYFIMKFKSLMIKYVSSKNIFSLSNHQFELINDIAFCSMMIKKRKKHISLHQYLCNFGKSIWKYIQSLPALHPYHPIALLMEFLQFLFILSQFFFLPISTSFKIELLNPYLEFIFISLPPFFFLFEIIFTLNKGFYKEGDVMIDRKLIIQNYFKNDFLVNILTTGALFWNLKFQQSFCSLIFLLRIPQLTRTMEQLDEHFHLQQKIPMAYELSTLLFQIFLVAHLYGCGFHFVGSHSDPNKNWIKEKKLDDNSEIERYITSIYFAIIAMITVGFGDIVPINMYEKIYVVLMTCFSCGIFAFAINTIGNIVKEKQLFYDELKKNKNSVLSYMQDRNIPKQNQNMVIRYLEYSHRNQDDKWSKGRDILQNMSKRIKEEFYEEFFQRVINAIPFLNNRSFSPKFKLEIQSHLQEAVFNPGEIIAELGQVSSHLFFIVTGEVQQFIPSCKTNLLTLRQGETFDEDSFISQLPCKYEYMSKTVTQVVILSRQKFEEIIVSFKSDYELLSMAAHEFIMKQNVQSKWCLSCKNKTHDVIVCPFIHYEVNYELLIKRFISSQPQKRQPKIRMIKIKKNSQYNLANIRKQLRNFRLQLPKMYEYHPNQINQSIFISETLFDIGQILEQDDATFIQITPRIVFNKQKQQIEQIIDDEEGEQEGEFEGGTYGEDDQYDKYEEQDHTQYRTGKSGETPKNSRQNEIPFSDHQAFSQNQPESDSPNQENQSKSSREVHENTSFQFEDKESPISKRNSQLSNHQGRNQILCKSENFEQIKQEPIQEDRSQESKQQKEEEKPFKGKSHSLIIFSQNKFSKKNNNKNIPDSLKPIEDNQQENNSNEKTTSQLNNLQSSKVTQKLKTSANPFSLALMKCKSNQKREEESEVERLSFDNSLQQKKNQDILKHQELKVAHQNQLSPFKSNNNKKNSQHSYQSNPMQENIQFNDQIPSHNNKPSEHNLKTNLEYSDPQSLFQDQDLTATKQQLNFKKSISRSACNIGTISSKSLLGSGSNIGGISQHQKGKAGRISINLTEQNGGISQTLFSEPFHNIKSSKINAIQPQRKSQSSESPNQQYLQSYYYENLHQQQLMQPLQLNQYLQLAQIYHPQLTQHQNSSKNIVIPQRFSRATTNKVATQIRLLKVLEDQKNGNQQNGGGDGELNFNNEVYSNENMSFMLEGFDQLKIFSHFLPHNNVDTIILEIRGKLKSQKTFPHRRNQKRVRNVRKRATIVANKQPLKFNKNSLSPLSS